MIITLIAQEKNIGLITLSNFLKENFNNTRDSHLSYLMPQKTVQDTLLDIEENKKNHNIIVKYVIPKMHFGNQGFKYPDELDNISDCIFIVPTYIEEIRQKTPLVFLKGKDSPICKVISRFYA